MTSAIVTETKSSRFRLKLRRGEVIVRIPQEQIQGHVDEALPLRGSVGPATFNIPTATVSLLASGRIHVTARMDADAAGVGISANIEASSEIRYQDGSFYLSNLAIKQVDIISPDSDGAEAKPSSMFGTVGRFAAAAAREGILRAAEGALKFVLDNRPVHTLQDKSFKESMAKLALREVSVEERVLVIRLNPVEAVVLRFTSAVLIIGVLVAAVSALVYLLAHPWG